MTAGTEAGPTSKNPCTALGNSQFNPLITDLGTSPQNSQGVTAKVTA